MDRHTRFKSQGFTTGLFFLMCAVLILTAAGCGDGSSQQGSAGQITPASAESGSASFSIQWHTDTTDRSAADSLERLAIADCATVGVASITSEVYDDSQNFIASGGPWPCDAHGGSVENISAGPNRTFAVLGWDAPNGSGSIVYRGQAAGITISPGVITDTGTIDAYEFFPTNLTANGVSNSQIDLDWTISAEIAGTIAYYNIYRAGSLHDTVSSAFYSDTSGLSSSTQYCYAVSAVDIYGNESRQTPEVCTSTNDNNGPAATITSPANNTTINQNTSIAFTGTGTDPEDGNLTGNALVWSSSIDGQIGTGNSFATDALSAGVHTIQLTATDSEGAQGSASISLTVNDTEAPTVPGGVAATARSSTQIEVSWLASTDNVGVAGYRIYNSDNVLLGEDNASPFVHDGLSPSTDYCYAVSAYDAAGNESPRSGTVCATTDRLNSILFLNFYIDITDQNSVDGYYQLAAFLRTGGYSVDQQNFKNITPSVLSPYDIIVFGGDLSRDISQSEADSIRRFVESGGRLLLLGDQGIETWSVTLRHDLHLVTNYNAAGTWGIGFDPTMLCDDVDYCTYCASQNDPDGGVDYPFIRPIGIHQSTSGVQQFVFNWGQPLLVNTKVARIVAASSTTSWADINSKYESGVDEYYCTFDVRLETRAARAAMAVYETGQGKVVAIGDNGMWFNYFFVYHVVGTQELANSVFTYLSQ